jgi:hypothetical protein
MLGLSIVLIAGLISTNAVNADSESTFVEYGGQPDTDGEYLVWSQQSFENVSDGERRYNLFAQHISTGERTLIIESSPSLQSPSVDDGIVVWAEDTPETASLSIFGYELSSGEQFMVSDGELYSSQPTVSGDMVVWRQMVDEGGGEHSHSIIGRNIATMDAPFTIREGDLARTLVFDANRLLWLEQDEANDGQLLTMTLDDNEPEVVLEVHIPPTMSFSYNLAGDLVVYKWLGSPITAVDLTTGYEVAIPAEPYDSSPVTDGRFVFWSGNDPDVSMRRVVSGYDLHSGSRFNVHGTGSGSGPSVAIGGGFLAWTMEAADPIVRELHLAPIANMLPSAPHAQPADDNPNRIWFPETGHSVVYGFKHFWEQSGGLPVFGFPLTEEFDELNQDLEEYFTVQYFERQRYEYHPEHAGTPYEVLLGRLGYEDAARRGLLDDEAFQPLEADPDEGDSCHFFEETGFLVCNEFLDYWQLHGLDFGDEGTSFRESLALFGYPISQGYFSEPGTGAEPVTVQYFERARFEFHPGNPEEHRVLLGRLGADLLDDLDW